MFAILFCGILSFFSIIVTVVVWAASVIACSIYIPALQYDARWIFSPKPKMSTRVKCPSTMWNAAIRPSSIPRNGKRWILLLKICHPSISFITRKTPWSPMAPICICCNLHNILQAHLSEEAAGLAFYYLNDRIAHSSTRVSANSRIIHGYGTAQKTKVGITPIPGHNPNFSCDIKRRTWFDFVSNQVLFLWSLR